MKRLLTVFAMTSTFAVATPAVADYDSCMKYCIPEHGFKHCHPICAGGENKTNKVESKANGDSNKVNRESAGNFRACNTQDDKVKAILVYVKNYHGPALVMTFPNDNNPNEFMVEAYPTDPDRNCKGTITFTANCDLLADVQCESPDKAQ